MTVAHDAIPRRAHDPGRRRLRRRRPGTGPRRSGRPAPGRRRDAGRRGRASNDRSVRRAADGRPRAVGDPPAAVDGRRPIPIAPDPRVRSAESPGTRSWSRPAAADRLVRRHGRVDRGPRTPTAGRRRSRSGEAATRPAGSDGRRHDRRDAPDAGPADRRDRCADERRIADERCELATRARAQADAALDALARRAARLRRARGRGRHGRLARRPARRPRGEGGGPGAASARPSRRRRRPTPLEAAARDWLTEINRINNEAREAPRPRPPRARRGGRDRGHPRTPRARGRRRPDRRRERRCGLLWPRAARSPTATSGPTPTPGSRDRRRRRRPAGAGAARGGRDARPGARGRRRRRGSSGCSAATARR